MISRSRPLRFLGVVAVGWATMRIALLWPSPAPTIPSFPAKLIRPSGAPAVARADPQERVVRDAKEARPAWARIVPVPRSGNVGAAPLRHRYQIDAGLLALASAAPVAGVQEGAIGLPLIPSSVDTRASWTRSPHASGPRWSGSAWLIARRAGPTEPFTGQLGGSQAGARVAYMLDTRRRIAAVARVAGALAARDTQASLGLEWQPTRAPFRLFAEHRLAIDGGRGGPAAGAIAGLNPVRVMRGVSLEGYGQAGVIIRHRGEGFADGALHASHPIAGAGRVRFEGGLGAWGGVQRGASRIDIGPSIAAIVPVANQRVRMTIDWRQRVAGNARPGSGLALTIGADF